MLESVQKDHNEDHYPEYIPLLPLFVTQGKLDEYFQVLQLFSDPFPLGRKSMAVVLGVVNMFQV